MKRNINIFEFPLSLGLTKKEHETETEVGKLPDWFRRFDFHSSMQPGNIFRHETPENLFENPLCFGKEITILYPDYGKNGIYTRLFVENLIHIIKNKED